MEGGEKWMPGIKIKENESFENALRRFKKQVEKTGILSEIRRGSITRSPASNARRRRWPPRKGQ